MFHILEQALARFVDFLEIFLELISVFCIVMGLVRTGQFVLMRTYSHQQLFGFHPFIAIRLRFGIWLALALEFQLGADILATTVAPSFESLGKLGAIALIRTFLNYFLNHELNEEYEFQERRKAAGD